MNRIAKFVVEHLWLARLLVLGVVLLSGWGASEVVLSEREQERLSLLETEAERRGIEIMSQTLNGNVMGALGLLGTIDQELKREARGEVNGKEKGDSTVELRGKSFVISSKNLENLESIGRSYDTEGAFIVKGDGMIGSGWDNSGKASTGLNVKFRPYYQMAMQGMENVYAAVSQARGDRMLYFSAPVFAETTNGTEAIGAVVARTGLMKIDNLLRNKADISLLLSPQQVVFAGSRAEWIGMLAAKPTPERLKAIREIKQFGDMFVSKDPLPLPISIDTGVRTLDNKPFAVASAKVRWNDPLGDWTLVMMEDLTRTVPLAARLQVGLGIAVVVLILGVLLLRLLRGHHAQQMAGAQLTLFAQAQQANAERKSAVAGVSLRLQQTKDVTQLVQVFLSELHGLMGVLQGVVYVKRANEEILHLAGSYACAEPPPPTLAEGVGLLGQCAVERRGQVIVIDAGRFAMVRSGLGETQPAAVIVAPILLNQILLGVVEIALLRVPGEEERVQFDELVALLAMSLEIVSRSAETEQVLSASLAAERTQAEQLTFQQALVDTIPYPVFYKDADTRFLGFNRAYEASFAIQRADLIGKRVIDLDYLPEADRIAYQAEDEAVIASAGSVKREVKLPFADGKLHDTLYFVSGFRCPDGSPGGLVGTFIDITALKEAERGMARMTDLERFNRLAFDREQRVVELKGEVNRLAAVLGQAAPYESAAMVELQAEVEAYVSEFGNPSVVDDVSSTVTLGELVDLAELQKLISSFCETVGVPAAIIDHDGKVLASSLWPSTGTGSHPIMPTSGNRSAPIIVDARSLGNVVIGPIPPGVQEESRLHAMLDFLTDFARMISSLSLARHRADLAQQKMQQQAELLRRERIAALSLAEDADAARHIANVAHQESQT